MFIIVCVFICSCSKSETDSIDYSLCFYEDDLSKNDSEKISNWLNAKNKTLGVEDDLLVSQCAMSVGDSKKASVFLSFVLDKDPNNIEALKIKAKLLIGSDNLMEAEKILSSLYQKNSVELEDIILLSNILNDLGSSDQSLKILGEQLRNWHERVPHVDASVTRVSLDEIELYMKKSEIEFNNEKFLDSVNTLKEGFSRNNGSVELFDALLYVLLSMKNQEMADFYISKSCSEPLISVSKYCH